MKSPSPSILLQVALSNRLTNITAGSVWAILMNLSFWAADSFWCIICLLSVPCVCSLCLSVFFVLHSPQNITCHSKSTYFIISAERCKLTCFVPYALSEDGFFFIWTPVLYNTKQISAVFQHTTAASCSHITSPRTKLQSPGEWEKLYWTSVSNAYSH